jgi:undecaprenyl-diphosphatase
MSLDETLFLWINGFAGKFAPLDIFMQGFANDYFFIVGACLVLLAIWFGTREAKQREKSQKAVMCVLLSVGIAQMFVQLSTVFYFRPRPFTELDMNLLFQQPTDSSFPSNSAVVIFAIAVAIFLADRKAGTLLLSLAVLHGMARIYVGIHYPLDVLVGAAIGAVTSLLVYRLARVLEPWPSRLLEFIRKFYLA